MTVGFISLGNVIERRGANIILPGEIEANIEDQDEIICEVDLT